MSSGINIPFNPGGFLAPSTPATSGTTIPTLPSSPGGATGGINTGGAPNPTSTGGDWANNGGATPTSNAGGTGPTTPATTGGDSSGTAAGGASAGGLGDLLGGGGAGGLGGGAGGGGSGVLGTSDRFSGYKDNPLNPYAQVAYHWRFYANGESERQGQPVTIAETGVTGFNIKEVSTTSYMAPSQRTRNSQMTEFRMTVVEAMGVSFLDGLMAAQIASGVQGNFQKNYYFLELRFTGYRQDGSIVPIITEGLPSRGMWTWKCVITNIDTTLHNGGAIYTLTMRVHHDVALYEPDVLRTLDTYKIPAETVGEFFKTLSGKMSESYKKHNQNDLVSYQFKFHGSNGLPSAESFKIKSQDSQEVDMRRGDSMTENSRDRWQGNVPTSTAVTDLVEWVISCSKEAQSIMIWGDRSKQPNQRPDGSYRVSVKYQAYPQVSWGQYDVTTGKYKKQITFHVKPYLTQMTVMDSSENMKNSQQNLQEAKKRMAKKYDYIFTGLNTEVLKCDIKFSTAWQAALPRIAGQFYWSDNVQQHARYDFQGEEEAKQFQQGNPGYQNAQGGGNPLGGLTSALGGLAGAAGQSGLGGFLGGLNNVTGGLGNIGNALSGLTNFTGQNGNNVQNLFNSIGNSPNALGGLINSIGQNLTNTGNNTATNTTGNNAATQTQTQTQTQTNTTGTTTTGPTTPGATPGTQTTTNGPGQTNAPTNAFLQSSQSWMPQVGSLLSGRAGFDSLANSQGGLGGGGATGANGGQYVEDILGQQTAASMMTIVSTMQNAQGARRAAGAGVTAQRSNRGRAIYGALLDQSYDLNAMQTIDIEIKGDPYWLGGPYDETTFGDSAPDQNAPNPTAGDICFLLVFRYPLGVTDTGQPNFKNQEAYTGLYRVQSIQHSFVDGKFTQTLHANRLQKVTTTDALKEDEQANAQAAQSIPASGNSSGTIGASFPGLPSFAGGNLGGTQGTGLNGTNTTGIGIPGTTTPTTSTTIPPTGIGTIGGTLTQGGGLYRAGTILTAPELSLDSSTITLGSGRRRG